MDTKKAIEYAGGPSAVADAISRRIKTISKQAVMAWSDKNSMPGSEFTGKTTYAQVIADLAVARGYDITPLMICPGAGQYMQQPEGKAA